MTTWEIFDVERHFAYVSFPSSRDGSQQVTMRRYILLGPGYRFRCLFDDLTMSYVWLHGQMWLDRNGSFFEATVEVCTAGPKAPSRPIDYVLVPLVRRFQACFTPKGRILDISFVVDADSTPRSRL